jgi:hypothetical protein
MSDFLDEVFKKDELVPTTVKTEKVAIERPTKDELEANELKKVENKLLKDNLAVLEQVPGWTELDPKHPEVMPEGWIEQYGEKEATRRHRIAWAAMLSGSKSPTGLKMAHETVMNIVKSKGDSRPAQQLNIQVVQIPIDKMPNTYEVIDVDE